jgi:hypothetical protein
MSQTWGRETGSIIVDGVVREMRNAYLYEAMRNWRAGCIERVRRGTHQDNYHQRWSEFRAGLRGDQLTSTRKGTGTRAC